MAPALVDTDTLSALMKQRPAALANAHAYLAIHNHLTLSVITRCEILRGLKAISATAKEAAFAQFCAANVILPVTDAIILRAAEIYADLYQQGLLIGDADILIAATALEHGLALVTNNTNHFNRIANLQLQNWLIP
jgi:tRNA(fMet)-specific endonuclease VapC